METFHRPPRSLGGFWRFCASRRTLVFSVCLVVYVLVLVLQVGHPSWPGWGRRSDRDSYRRSRGLYHFQAGDALRAPGAADPAGPTRSNVVYITFRAKRQKPAILRGTVKPKARRKSRRNNQDYAAPTQNRARTLARPGQARTLGSNSTSWGETEISNMDYRLSEVNQTSHTDPQVSSIRIYSQRAPPWLGAEDVRAMRFLAGAKVARIREVSSRGFTSFLMSESDTDQTRTPPGVCGGRCGLIRSPVDSTEVFGFHLDRVLGLNRTLPAATRRFRVLHDGQPCPVVLWDASLYPEGLAASRSTVRLTWGEYQSSLKQRCWHRNVAPKPESGCSTVHHYEWSKLALFDFLLQIHNRLDQCCCGFRPRAQDVCVKQGLHAECVERGRIALADIVHRSHDPRRLVFSNNKGFFDRNEDNLDFQLLDGIKELPERSVEVLRSGRLRQCLLQSLFLDQVFWESQGGRRGIDKLIEVVERRAKVLLTFINAHGIKVTPMGG